MNYPDLAPPDHLPSHGRLISDRPRRWYLLTVTSTDGLEWEAHYLADSRGDAIWMAIYDSGLPIHRVHCIESDPPDLP